MIIVDTDVLIWVLRGQENCIESLLLSKEVDVCTFNQILFIYAK